MIVPTAPKPAAIQNPGSRCGGAPPVERREKGEQAEGADGEGESLPGRHEPLDVCQLGQPLGDSGSGNDQDDGQQQHPAGTEAQLQRRPAFAATRRDRRSFARYEPAPA